MAAINEKGLLGKFLVWRVRYIKEKQFIVMLSILVGIVTGLAGVVLKNMVHFTHMFFTSRARRAMRRPAAGTSSGFTSVLKAT